MVRLSKCGHPVEWTIRLVGAGLKFTYCLGCLIEKTGLTNLEGYENKYIKHEKTGLRPGMMTQKSADKMVKAASKAKTTTKVKSNTPK